MHGINFAQFIAQDKTAFPMLQTTVVYAFHHGLTIHQQNYAQYIILQDMS